MATLFPDDRPGLHCGALERFALESLAQPLPGRSSGTPLRLMPADLPAADLHLFPDDRPGLHCGHAVLVIARTMFHHSSRTIVRDSIAARAR